MSTEMDYALNEVDNPLPSVFTPECVHEICLEM